MSRNIDYENKLKKCNQCKQVKSFDNFYKSGMGLQYICKECVKENKKNNKNAELIIKYKEVLDKIKDYIDNYDVFKEFTFPLMKRDEEQQVLTSIKYEFDTSIKKNLDKLLEEIE